jgi:hypothetical protein
MPRMRNIRILETLEGKLGLLRREVQKVMGGLKREIDRREGELAGLKAEYTKGMELIGGKGRSATPPAPRRTRRRRARPLDWKQVYGSLPARFTLEVLSRHPSAGKRSKAHLYAIISRWKKEKKITKDATGAYRKLEGAPAAKRGRRAPKPKAAAAPKASAARPESPGA